MDMRNNITTGVNVMPAEKWKKLKRKNWNICESLIKLTVINIYRRNWKILFFFTFKKEQS